MMPWEEAASGGPALAETPPWEEAAGIVPEQDSTGLQAAITSAGREGQLRTQGLEMSGDPAAGLRDIATQFNTTFNPPNSTGTFGSGALAGIESLGLTPRIINALMVSGGKMFGLGNTELVKQNQAVLEGYRQKEMDIQARAGNSIPAQLGMGLTKGAGELPLYLGPGMVAKTPEIGLKISSLIAGLMGGGTQLSQDLGDQKPLSEALPYAVTQGGIDALTTRAFGLTGAESALAKGSMPRGLGAIRNAAVAEGAEEMTATGLQDINERFVRNPEKPVAETVKELGLSGVIGAALGGGVTAGGQAANSAVDYAQEQQYDSALTKMAQDYALQATFPWQEAAQARVETKPVEVDKVALQKELDALRVDPYVTGKEVTFDKDGKKVTQEVIIDQRKVARLTELEGILGGGLNGKSQEQNQKQGQEVLTKVDKVEPPEGANPPVVKFDPEHLSMAKVLDLKPEGGFEVEGLPKQWGFSPIDNTEIGTFYVPAGSTLPEIQKAWEAKKAEFEAAKVKPPVVEPPVQPPVVVPPPVEPPVQPPVAVARPKWVDTIEEMVKQGTANEGHKERLAKWYAANKVTPPVVPPKVEPPKPDEEGTLLKEINVTRRGIQKKLDLSELDPLYRKAYNDRLNELDKSNVENGPSFFLHEQYLKLEASIDEAHTYIKKTKDEAFKKTHAGFSNELDELNRRGIDLKRGNKANKAFSAHVEALRSEHLADRDTAKARRKFEVLKRELDEHEVLHSLKNVAQMIHDPALKSQRDLLLTIGEQIHQRFMAGEITFEQAKQDLAGYQRGVEAKLKEAKDTAKTPTVEKPDWVKVIDDLIKQGTATPAHLERYKQWHTENGLPVPELPKVPLRSTPEKPGNVPIEVTLEEAKELGVQHGKNLVTPLERLAKDREKHGAYSVLAQFLLDHFKPAIVTTTVDLKTPMSKWRGTNRMHYDPDPHAVRGLTMEYSFPMSQRVIHEGTHAATAWAIAMGTTPEAKTAKQNLEVLRKKVRAGIKEAGKNATAFEKLTLDYYTSNVDEFMAGIFSSQYFRDHLNNIKMDDGTTTALNKAIEWILDALGVKRDSVLARSFHEIIRGAPKSVQDINKDRTKHKLPPVKELGSGKVPVFENVGKTEVRDAITVPPSTTTWSGTRPDPLPFRYKAYAEEKTDATTARGAGTVWGLSRLFDPRSYKTSPEERVILANGISKAKADAGVATWLEQKKSAERAFPVDENGQVTLANGGKSYMSDVIEAEIANPGSQGLTPEQTAFVDMWKALNEEGIRYAAANGVKFFMDEDGNPIRIDDPHFPRPRVGTVGEPAQAQSMAEGAKPGAKQGPFKARYHETEAEGRAADVKYESDEYARIGDWLRAVYRSVADTKLAEDPALKGRLGMRLVPSGIYDKNGFMTYSMVGHGPGYGEGEVFGVPALKGRVFSRATADKLTAFYQNNIPNALRHVIDINNRLKAVKFTLDVSAPFNQGLAMMATNPVRWAKATLMSYKAWFDDKTLSKYLNIPENAAAAREYVENGGSLVRLQDFLSGAESDKEITALKPIDRVIHASGRSMGTFLSISKIEMYKALKPLAKGDKTKLAELAESVDNKIFSGRMEQIGVTQGRALIERVLFNAPSYLRAFTNLAVEGAKGAAKTVVGKETSISEKTARNAIVGMLGVVSAQMFAAYKIQGLSDDEIKERFDPRSGKFLRISIPMGNGKSVELGYGNIVLSFTRLLGDTAEVLQGTKPLRPGTEGNPWIRWLSYRKSPVVDAIWQGFTGKDFQGNDVGPLEVIGRSVIPIPVEPMATHLLKGEGTLKTASLETTAQFFGLNAFTKEKPSLEEASRTKYGKSVSKLTVRERFDLKRELDALPKSSMKDTERATVQATKNEFQRRREVLDDLSSPTQKFLKTNEIALPSFQAGFEVKGKNIPLSADERKQHQEFVTEEYQKSLDALMASPRIQEFVKDKSLQKRVNIILKDANARARLRLKREVRAVTPSS